MTIQVRAAIRMRLMAPAARSGTMDHRRRGRSAPTDQRRRVAQNLPSDVRDPVPARFGSQADRLVPAVGLDVDERIGAIVKPDVELALLDPLVKPGATEDETAQPMDERAL